jgi:hypothetical protein
MMIILDRKVYCLAISLVEKKINYTLQHTHTIKAVSNQIDKKILYIQNMPLQVLILYRAC